MAHSNDLGSCRSNSRNDGVVTIYCKLFSDRVTWHLCELRRKELNSKGGFSCSGCAMESDRFNIIPNDEAVKPRPPHT